jgi:hypothetical protein
MPRRCLDRCGWAVFRIENLGITTRASVDGVVSAVFSGGGTAA